MILSLPMVFITGLILPPPVLQTLVALFVIGF